MHDWRSEFNRLEGAYAPQTIRGYFTDLRAYEAWCAQRDVAPLPASCEQVCAFLEDQARSMTTGTVQRRLYAIRKAHRLLQLPDPTTDEEINLTLRRVRRQNHVRPRQAKGLTRDYLMRFLETEPDTPTGKRNRAMISLGYDLLMRRSELVALRDADVEPCSDGTYRFLIRRSKADPFGAGRTAFCSRRTAGLLEDWWAWRGPCEWLFCPIYQDKAVNRSLSVATVKRLIRSAAERCCEADVAQAFSGHSMRVGAAQDLL